MYCKPNSAPITNRKASKVQSAHSKREQVLSLIYKDRRIAEEHSMNDRRKNALSSLHPVFSDSAKIFRLVASKNETV